VVDSRIDSAQFNWHRDRGEIHTSEQGYCTNMKVRAETSMKGDSKTLGEKWMCFKEYKRRRGKRVG